MSKVCGSARSLSSYFAPIALLAFLWGTPAFAQDIYADNTTTGGCGNGSTDYDPSTDACGAGADTVYITAAAGCAALTSGQVMEIANGTYAESLSDCIPSGSSGDPTVVQAETAGMVTFNPSGNATMVSIDNKSYITVDGLVLDGVNATTSRGFAISNQSSSNIIFRDVTSLNHTGCGASAQGTDHQFFDTIVHDTTEGGSCPNSAHGFYFQGNDGLIDGGEFYNTGTNGYGLLLYNINSGSTISGNIARNFVVHDAGNNGLLCGGGNDAFNNSCYNFASYDNDNAGAVIQGDNSSIYFATVVGNGGDGVFMWEFAGGNTVRNILCANNSEECVDDDGGNTVSNTLDDAVGEFTDLQNRDLTLAMGADAIGAGVAVVGVPSDFEGDLRSDPPDLGYDEFSGESPVSGSITLEEPNAGQRFLRPDPAIGVSWSSVDVTGNVDICTSPAGADGFFSLATLADSNPATVAFDSSPQSVLGNWPASTTTVIGIEADGTDGNCDLGHASAAISGEFTIVGEYLAELLMPRSLQDTTEFLWRHRN